MGDGTLYCKFYDKVNTANYIEFLVGVHKKYGKFVLFLDNAAYHKSKALKEFLVGMGDQIKIVYFPPYTPDLNPIEGEWKMFKKYTGNRLYQSVDEMQKSIREMLRKKEIPVVKMSAYLRR